MENRPDLNSLAAEERTALVDLMLPYLTDEVVANHVKIVHFGELHFIGHHEYIKELEAYLRAHGGERFVPIPKWNPASLVPIEFNVVKAQDDGTPRPPLVNLNPNMPLPERFVAPMLCDYKDADTLGNEVNPWHVHVHTTVGGTMGQFKIASATPLFWCFHAFVGEIYFEWQRLCQKQQA